MLSRLIVKGSQGPTRGFALQALASCSAAPRLGFAACGANDVPVGAVAIRNTNRAGYGSPLQFSHGFAANPEVRTSLCLQIFLLKVFLPAMLGKLWFVPLLYSFGSESSALAAA